MERAQASGSSSSSAPAPSNPIITSSSSSNNSQGMASISSSVSSNVSASSRQQTLPQISVYGGLPDRQTVQCKFESELVTLLPSWSSAALMVLCCPLQVTFIIT
ncbi:uncharacterized [Tachysurus ichikawai]